jgi:GntR family transcriptional regulator, carbon starvation induced regulator
MKLEPSDLAFMPQSDDTRLKTLGDEIFERLRADIISSRLMPGKKLRFHDLRETYGVGVSPLREALSRLAENRLVVATGQRGFHVSEVSVENITDVAMVRRHVDGLALRLSIEHGDDSWEGELLSARHKLAVLERAGSNVAENLWERRHRDFHYTLISACRSPCLLHLHGMLNDQFDRYRRLSAKSAQQSGPRALMHKQILEASLARNADKAVKLLEGHIAEATKWIVAGLRDQPGSARGPAQVRKKSRTKARV